MSANASERMRAMLSQQQINHKIPSLLPPTVRVEHKTGEDEGITNDVGDSIWERTLCSGIGIQ